MRLHFLGTTGYHPNELRQTACLMLPELGLVLDAGTGFFRVGPLIQTQAISVLLTHAHLDHSIGLTYLWDVLTTRPELEFTVYAGAEAIRAIREHLFAPPLFPVPPPLRFVAIESPGAWRLPSGETIRHFPLQHPGGSLGFRLDAGGQSFAYVTDTVATENAAYLDEVRGVDLLVHECYFADGYEALAEKTGHSCLSQVVRLAARAAVKRLALVHVNPLDPAGAMLNLSAARAVFPELILPADHDVLEI